MFDGAQVHLLLNHLPILGIPFSLLLLLFGLWRKSIEIQKASMGALVLVGLLAIPVLKSGEAAEEIVEELPGISEMMIEEHEESAEIAFWFLEALAALSLGGLVYFRGPRKTPKWYAMILLVGMIIGGGLMARTAHMGGQINHPEIRSGEVGPDIPTQNNEHEEENDH